MAVSIESLALIGDRKTLAMVTKEGTICWYCPGRFDGPSLFASLLDDSKGGAWSLKWQDARFAERAYEGDSAILKSTYRNPMGEESFMLDFMPVGEEIPNGICRMIKTASSSCIVELKPAPEYGEEEPFFEQKNGMITIQDKYTFYCTHEAEVLEKSRIIIHIPAHSEGWMVLLNDHVVHPPDPEDLLSSTRSFWEKVAGRFSYHGPYEEQMAQSIRAIRLLTHGETGGILAAGTTSLPEVPGGERNYDYRYVWLRDAAMIVSALTRAGSDGTDERMFLSFICGLEKVKREGGNSFAPMYNLDFKQVPEIQELNLQGYLNSQPVVRGNGARGQLQLDTSANVLLAAKLIYNKFDTKEHWEVVSETADFLARNWQKEDKGIWEETTSRHYTTSKVITAVGLKFIAQHTKDSQQRKRWLAAENDIRDFVQSHCLTSEGAYAAAAGEEAVDISSILFPSWAFCKADTKEMLATVKVLERDYQQENLFRRHLFEVENKKEGAFLAGSLWMAQYWVYRNELKKAMKILEEVMKYSTDLGFFSEEADLENRRMMGNIPQTFVHASFVGTVIDLKNQLKKNN